MFALGALYAGGDDLPEDRAAEVCRWLEQAVAQNIEEAQVNLAALPNRPCGRAERLIPRPAMPVARIIAMAKILQLGQYVRMSTEHRRYSTENQSEAILQYAVRYGFGF
jgi:hypothetical protein